MEFKCSAGGKLISRNTYLDNFDGNDAVAENVLRWKSETASLQLNEKWFTGIHIVLMDINALSTEVFLLECSQAHIGFIFCLNGAIDYADKHGDYSPLLTNEQDLNLGSVDTFKFRVTEAATLLYIQLTETYFSKIAGNATTNVLYGVQPIKPETNSILQHIINNKHEERAKRLFLEARIFELIIVYLHQAEEKQAVTFKQEDINKIMLAKQLVEQDLQKPNSLIELSRKAGINDYKLKKGFKELTGHTVFGYLYKIRMEKAHYFLSKEKKTVNEVAFLVGYKNAQHFIAAFKKKYHILPGSLNKN